jgi:ABC-type lipoprotein export system ATPase subunit
MKNIHSDLIPDKTLLKCFKILDSLKVGQMILVNDYAKVNPELFISCCKRYYNLYQTIRFLDDYSVIKKIERDLTFNEINEQYKNYLGV